MNGYDPFELAADLQVGGQSVPRGGQGLAERGFVVLDHQVDGSWLELLCYRAGNWHPYEPSDRGCHFIDIWQLYYGWSRSSLLAHASLLADAPDETTFLRLTDRPSFPVGGCTTFHSGPELVELDMDPHSIESVMRASLVVRLAAGVRSARPVVGGADAPVERRPEHTQGWLLLSTLSPIQWIELEHNDGSVELISA